MSQANKGFTAQLDSSVLLQRWRALAPREQLSLASLAGFLLLVLLYLTLWQPAQQRLAAARAAFETQRELNAYLHSQAPLARSLASVPQASVDPARLQGLVTASATTQGLTIERLDSDGEGVLQVSVQAAPFAQLLRWFAALQEQGVQIAEAGLDRGGDNLVAARLSLRVAQ
ncbi:type II secretion system protein M [Pseudomonas sp.]|uniref:type II secretion system protein M n=1 Tax=Pseudomonas sp. TaxID=306 RepID=UPI003C74E674